MDRNEATLIKAIETIYFQHLVLSYETWSKPRPGEDTTIRDKMLKEFTDGLSYKKGRNYVKVISSRDGSHRNVHSFIVLKPTKGFEIGDILKAASWNAPATNFKRGNVFCPALFAAVTWTGAG